MVDIQKGGSKIIIHVAGGIFLLAASAVMIWQMTGPTWFKNIKAEVTNQPYARTISVSAEGKITAKPDIAIINLSVVSQGKGVKDVTRDGNVKMTAIIDAVKKIGVEAKDVTTSSYDLYPDYSYIERQTPKIVGYRLNQGITVKIRKLDIVDDVLDAALKAGANQVGQLSFDIDDTSNIKKEAREEAFKKSREKAEEMAAAAGVRLGRVVTFSESSDIYYPQAYPNFERKLIMSDSVDVPAPSIEPGSKDLTVSVSVTYEIE